MIAFKPDRLKEIRRQTSLTQKDFSEKIGCTMASLSAYENGSKIPPTQTLINIAEQFHCSIDWLMGLKDDQHYGNNSNSPKTYAGYIRRLFALQAPNIYMAKNCDCAVGSDSEINHKGIAFADPVIKLFLKSWEKTFDLYKDGTIDSTIYEAWKEKVLRDFDKHILSDDMDWEEFYRDYTQYKGIPGISEYDVVLNALSSRRDVFVIPDHEEIKIDE